jgi:hypothetical protein
MDSVQTEYIAKTNMDVSNKTIESAVRSARYKASIEESAFSWIDDILNEFQDVKSKIEKHFEFLSTLGNSDNLLNFGNINCECVFTFEKMDTILLILDGQLPKLIPELETKILNEGLLLVYKERKFTMAFTSSCNNSKVSNRMVLSTLEMHQYLKCKSTGIVANIDIDKMSAREFVILLQNLLNLTYTDDCHNCGHIVY